MAAPRKPGVQREVTLPSSNLTPSTHMVWPTAPLRTIVGHRDVTPLGTWMTMTSRCQPSGKAELSEVRRTVPTGWGRGVTCVPAAEP